MSSLHVRTLARQWIVGVGVPFHETINTNANPQDPIWVTLDFQSEYTEVSTFCDDYIETGVIEMVYRVEGTGDLQLTVRLLGEVVLVSVIAGLCCRDRKVCALLILFTYLFVRACG